MQNEVKSNKEHIHSTKAKLEGLEVQIVEISEKMDKFRDATDMIIQGISRRIQEAEEVYQEAKSPNITKAQ